MRTLAIGDIHGCFKALSALLTAVSPEPSDRIVFLGDYVDRGDDSRAVLELCVSDPRLKQAVFLRGNHEVMMLESRTHRLKAQSWHSFGGFETILSYGAGNVRDWQSAVPQEHWDFLEQTVLFLETDTHIFAHGSVAPDLDLNEQSEWQLLWERFDSLKPHKSGKKVVCGHTPQGGDLITDIGYAVCVDTGAVFGGWLSCLDVVSGAFWQANEQGEIRTGSLQP